MAIYDGLDLVQNGGPSTSTVGGFLVPPSSFTGSLGLAVLEGDGGITGDQVFFNGGAALSDAQNSADNFFNSTRSLLGSPLSVAGDLPQLTGAAGSLCGLDLDVVDVTAHLSAGQTSAPLSFTSSGDLYFLASFALAIDTAMPDLTGTTKTATDLNGGMLIVGDVLEYAITVSNSGSDGASSTVLADTLPAEVAYIPGSLVVTAGTNDGAKTDAAGDDQAEYEAATRTVRFRLGTGADAATGGTLAAGAVTAVRFQATVLPTTNLTVSNQATVTASGVTGAPSADWLSDGDAGSAGPQPTVSMVTPSGDLSIAKSAGTMRVPPGGLATYTIIASNAGPGDCTGAVVSDAFPPGFACTWSCTGAGCTAAAGTGDISQAVNLLAGATITFAATCTAGASTAGTTINTATIVAPPGFVDPSPGDHAASAEVLVAPDIAMLGLPGILVLLGLVAGVGVGAFRRLGA